MRKASLAAAAAVALGAGGWAAHAATHPASVTYPNVWRCSCGPGLVDPGQGLEPAPTMAYPTLDALPRSPGD
jgi:hypothetical protein